MANPRVSASARGLPAPSAATRIAVIATSTVLGGVIAMGGVIASNTIEPGLMAKTDTALADAGIAGVNVRFTGREAFLSSDSASPAQLVAAEAVVESVYGVRWATIVAPGTAGSEPTATPTPSPTATPTPTQPPQPTPEENAYLTTTNILFEPDSIALTPVAMQQLDRVADILNRYTELGVKVTGHIAIPVGTEADAIAFSQKRAQVAVDYLASLGVDAGRLTVVGAGTGDEAGDNSTAEGAASNRRVTFTIEEAH